MNPTRNADFWFFQEGEIDLDAPQSLLIVEDDSSTIKLFKAMIHNFDEDVRIKSFPSAESAERYLMHVRKHDLPGPDVAMVDYRLAGKDGISVCQFLETYFPMTKVILVSGTGASEMAQTLKAHCLEVEFVQKPVRRDQILQILKS